MTDKRSTIALTEERTAELRRVAADYAGSPGLVARALVLWGLDNLDHPAIQAAITAEIAADRQRRAAVGRRVMQRKHHGEEESP